MMSMHIRDAAHLHGLLTEGASAVAGSRKTRACVLLFGHCEDMYDWRVLHGAVSPDQQVGVPGARRLSDLRGVSWQIDARKDTDAPNP